MKQTIHVYARWLPGLIVAMVLIVILIGDLALQYVETHLVAAAGASLTVAAVDIAAKLEMLLDERYGDIQMLAYSQIFQSRDAAVMTRYLEWMVTAYPMYSWLGVTDAVGRIVAATDPASVGQDRSDRAWFQAVRDRGRIDIRDAQISEDAHGVIAVAFTAPISGPRGEFLGTVTTRVALPALEHEFTETVQALQAQWGTAAPIEYQFVTETGDLTADSRLREEGRVNLKHLRVPSAQLVMSAPPGFVEEPHGRRPMAVVTGYARTKGIKDTQRLQWGVLVRVDRSDILVPIRIILWKLGAAGLVVVAPLLGLLFWTMGRLQHEYVAARKAEAATQEMLDTLDVSYDGFFIFDAETLRFLYVNQGAQIQTGYSREELLAMTPVDLQPTFDAPQFRDRLTQLRVEPSHMRIFTTVHRRKDGGEVPVEIALQYLASQGQPGHCIAAVRDITERKMMETQSRRLERLAAMGQLLGGIVHEVRNPVFILIGRLQLLREKLASREYDQLSGDLQKTEGVAQRIITVMQRFLALAKPYQASVGPCLVQEVLREICGFLANECMRQHVRVDTSWSPPLPPVRADQHQLGDAVMNLMLNAIQTMAAAHGGGTLTVRAQLSAVSPQSSAQDQGGPWIEVRIQDDGPGIAPEHRAKLFEPFFSTKPPGEGTGLGLWMVRTFVMTHQGTVDYETEVGRGTTFIVRLPVLSPAQPGANNSPAG